MSTNIWEEGPVYATLCAQRCDRCDPNSDGRLTRCLQLVDSGHSPITLCLRCFAELCYAAGRAAGEQEREKS